VFPAVLISFNWVHAGDCCRVTSHTSLGNECSEYQYKKKLPLVWLGSKRFCRGKCEIFTKVRCLVKFHFYAFFTHSSESELTMKKTCHSPAFFISQSFEHTYTFIYLHMYVYIYTYIYIYVYIYIFLIVAPCISSNYLISILTDAHA